LDAVRRPGRCWTAGPTKGRPGAALAAKAAMSRWMFRNWSGASRARPSRSRSHSSAVSCGTSASARQQPPQPLPHCQSGCASRMAHTRALMSAWSCAKGCMAGWSMLASIRLSLSLGLHPADASVGRNHDS
jgi:hypothetical protein